MDLRQITYFVQVAELGSFTRASLVLDVAQPALSRQVRLLEVELGQPLLLRTGRGVTPTEAGRLLLERGRGLLHQVDNLRDELARLGEGTRGRVALGMPPTLSKVLTVPLVRAAARHLPGVTLSISEGLSSATLEALGSGSLDVALVYEPVSWPGIASEPVYEEALLLVSRASAGAQPDPIALSEVARRPLVIPRRPNTLRMLVESALARHGLAPTIAIEVDGVDAILGLVADGVGHALLSANAVRTAAEPGRFLARPIVSPTLSARILLATSAQRPTTQAQQSMITLLRSGLPAALDPARDDRDGAPTFWL
ncbi:MULTISPECIES: LysR family transcriptional regulator [unclassified Luteimonas]